MLGGDLVVVKLEITSKAEFCVVVVTVSGCSGGFTIGTNGKLNTTHIDNIGQRIVRRPLLKVLYP